MNVINQKAKLIKPVDPVAAIQSQVKMCQFAGRNCYASQDKINDNSYERFIDSLIERGHGSPLEFGDMTYDITTSRAVLAELTRHRLASFCVESQRYIQEAKSGDIDFIQPPWFGKKNDKADTVWLQMMTADENSYKFLIEAGMKPEEAREVLPNSTACRIIMKANLREWRHIFTLRCSKRAYPQMRELMLDMLEQAHETVPKVFDDLYAEFITESEINND